MATREELVIPIDVFILRIAWLEYHGDHSAANALRDLAAWAVPAYHVDGEEVRAHVAEFRRQAAQPPRPD